MAPTKKPALTRRTRLEIDKLSVDEVTTELVARQIRPVEFVRVADDDPYYRTKLELWQRYDLGEYAPRSISIDPFILDHYTRFPLDDLRTIHRGQLYDHELSTFTNGLSLASLKAQLKAVTVDEGHDRKPEPNWSADQYRNELASRIRALETITPTTKRRRPS